jgi:alpha-ribazole phosphatase
MRLLLIRHPKPVIAPDTCYGRLDIPPDHDDLQALLQRLSQSARPARVYSSPLQRCLRAATAMQQHGWPEPIVDANLAEMNFGDWEGRHWDDIGRDALEQWRKNMADFVPPGGESVTQLAQRALLFAHTMVAAHRSPAPGLEIGVFTHAGIIQTLPRIWHGQALSGFGSTRIGYGSVTELILKPEQSS